MWDKGVEHEVPSLFGTNNLTPFDPGKTGSLITRGELPIKKSISATNNIGSYSEWEVNLPRGFYIVCYILHTYLETSVTRSLNPS